MSELKWVAVTTVPHGTYNVSHKSGGAHSLHYIARGWEGLPIHVADGNLAELAESAANHNIQATLVSPVTEVNEAAPEPTVQKRRVIPFYMTMLGSKTVTVVMHDRHFIDDLAQWLRKNVKFDNAINGWPVSSELVPDMVLVADKAGMELQKVSVVTDVSEVTDTGFPDYESENRA